jgi:hypothetical protein
MSFRARTVSGISSFPHLKASFSLCAIGLFIALSIRPALAQADKYENPVDLKPLIPPVFSPLPPNARINPGALNSAPIPYGATPAPLQNPSQSQQAPGFRLIIPR